MLVVLLRREVLKFVRRHPRYYGSARFQHKQFNDSYTAKDFLPRDYKRFVEDKWQRIVLTSSSAASSSIPPNQEKKYVLSMFPYPSGKLHMGHVRVYTISDVLARFHRLRNCRVIHPMGWDAFGLPAENAAIERKQTPDKWTYSNIAFMREQLDQLALDFDWNREFATCDSNYYKWTQSIFLDLYDAGLAYRANGWVNWDPVDKTVLAEEQVDQSGRSWRSGAVVERKLLKQWFIRTTRFAEDLFGSLTEEQMEGGWRDVALVQRNWIGRPDGVRVQFPISFEGEMAASSECDEFITSWTEKPHLLFKAGFLVVKPEHPAVFGRLSGPSGMFQAVLYVKNPLTNFEMPVFVMNEQEVEEKLGLQYPENHDTFIGFPLEIPLHDEALRTAGFSTPAWIDVINSQTWKTLFNGPVEPSRNEAEKAICNYLLKHRLGGYKTSSRLRDWLVSRQRFWGTPIPFIHCKSCGVVPERNLPVKLPVCFTLPEGASPLKYFAEWSNAQCPSCGSPAVRESDTMDTFMDSSWYYLRYLDPRNKTEPFSRRAAQDVPVDVYVGGKDHAVLHLFYARFMHKFFQSQGRVESPEPFQALCPVGQVMAMTYKTKKTGKYLSTDMISSAEGCDHKNALLVDKATGEGVDVLWEKMSKSRHNGVDPKETVDRIGIDTLRLLILDDAVPRSERRFSLHTLPGIERWQKRLVETVEEFCVARRVNGIGAASSTSSSWTPAAFTSSPSPASSTGSASSANASGKSEEQVPWLLSREAKALGAKELKNHEAELVKLRNDLTSIITHEINTLNRISVAIRRMMGITKDLRARPRSVVQKSAEYEKLLASQIIMLAPLAPHLACELWDGIAAVEKHSTDIFDWKENVLAQKWPEVDADFSLNFIVSVNGREKAHTQLPKQELFQLSDDEAVKRAKMLPQLETLLKSVEESLLTLEDGCWVTRSADYSVNVHFKVPNNLLHVRWPSDAKKAVATEGG